MVFERASVALSRTGVQGVVAALLGTPTYSRHSPATPSSELILVVLTALIQAALTGTGVLDTLLWTGVHGYFSFAQKHTVTKCAHYTTHYSRLSSARRWKALQLVIAASSEEEEAAMGLLRDTP